MPSEIVELEVTASTSGRKRTTALFPDSLRYQIIEEIKQRPLLWDNRLPRESMSLIQRKQEYIAIANTLTSDDTPLTHPDIEKQWKNLKDTFFKVKRKYLESGPSSQNELPRWRFYGALGFLEQIDCDGRATSPGFPPASGSSVNATDTDSGDEGTHRKRRKTAHTATPVIVPPALPSSPAISEPKSSSVLKKVSSSSKPLNFASPLTECRSPMPPTPGTSFYVDDDDKYSHYGQYLARQFREIGSVNPTEFFKLQKAINDVVTDAFIRLHESPNHNSSKHRS